MKTLFTLQQDIHTGCLKASSFPDGVLAAHEQLHQLVPPAPGRRSFGLSRPDHTRSILYWAAAEELQEGETASWGLETFLLKKGVYASVLIRNYMQDIPAIGHAFREILQEPDLDPDGICIEWYLNDTDVQCMVRLLRS